MAIFNEILAGRFNRSLQKIFAVKGSAPVRQIAGEIMPVHALESGAEARYLEGWTQFGFVMRQQNPGQVVGIRARNPAGTNVVAVIEQMLITMGAVGEVQTADSVHIRFGNANTPFDQTISLPGAGQRLDFRTVGGNPGGSSLTWSHNTVGPALITGTQEIGFVASTGIAYTTIPYISGDNQEITILPGDAIQIDDDALSLFLSLSMIWRERLLEESERQ